MKKNKQQPKASKVLGILSICLFWTNWVGMTLAIIGLSIKKDEEHKGRDITLNVIGLIMSGLWTLLVFSIMMSAMSAFM